MAVALVCTRLHSMDCVPPAAVKPLCVDILLITLQSLRERTNMHAFRLTI